MKVFYYSDQLPFLLFGLKNESLSSRQIQLSERFLIWTWSRKDCLDWVYAATLTVLKSSWDLSMQPCSITFSGSLLNINLVKQNWTPFSTQQHSTQLSITAAMKLLPGALELGCDPKCSPVIAFPLLTHHSRFYTLPWLKCTAHCMETSPWNPSPFIISRWESLMSFQCLYLLQRYSLSSRNHQGTQAAGQWSGALNALYVVLSHLALTLMEHKPPSLLNSLPPDISFLLTVINCWHRQSPGRLISFTLV